MRVLIVCESSGMTRRAFERQGFDAWSCDLLPAKDGSPKHIQGDMFEVLARSGTWDLVIAHPTCTFLTISAAWAFNDPNFEKYPGVGYHQKVKPGTLTGAARRTARDSALDDVRHIMAWHKDGIAKRLAIENPIGAISKAILPPDQIIQPYHFGDDASKSTCLWLFDLPPLKHGKRFNGRLVEWPKGSGSMVERWSNQTDSGQNNKTPGDLRWQDRSETFPGIADAFALQWGNFMRGIFLLT
jgi:hypothetical protein